MHGMRLLKDYFYYTIHCIRSSLCSCKGIQVLLMSPTVTLPAMYSAMLQLSWTFLRFALWKHHATWHRVWSRPWNYIARFYQFTEINPVEILVWPHRTRNVHDQWRAMEVLCNSVRQHVSLPNRQLLNFILGFRYSGEKSEMWMDSNSTRQAVLG